MNRNSIASVSHSYLSLIVLRILAANGFNRSSQQSIESLTHVLECFLLNLAQSAADYAHIGRRSDVSTHDAASAVHDALGDNYLDSLHDLIEDSPRLHLNKSPWEIECQKALSDPEFVGYNLRPRAVRYDYDRVPEFPTASLTRSSSDMDIEDDNDLFGQSEQQQEAVEVEKEIDCEETFDVDDATLIPPKKRFKDDAQLVPAGFPDLPTQNPLEDLPDAEDIHATPQLPKARQQDVTQDIYDPYLNPIPYNQSQLSSLHPYTPLTAENSKEGADSVSEADFLALLLNAHSSAAQIPQLNKSNGKNVQRERVGTLLSAVTLSDFSAADSLYGMFPAAGLKTQATAPAPSHYQSNKEKESMDNYADKLRPVAALPSSAVAANALFKARSPLAALARVLPSDFNRRVTRMKHPEALHDPAHKHKFTYGRPHSVPGKEKDEKGHLIYTWDHKLKDWVSDHEDQPTFESAGAGAAQTYPAQCSSLRKNGHVVIKGMPCKIVDMSTSKTGKHGHAKVNLTALDIFTGKKYEDVSPSTHNMDVPNVKRTEFQLVDVDDGFLSLLMPNGDSKDDVKVPEGELGEKLEKDFKDGKDLMVSILSAMDRESCVGYKEAPQN